MKILHNESLQSVSWVKSNKERLDAGCRIGNLYYPDTLDELRDLIQEFIVNNKCFELIGYSSNTLFLPTHYVENLICTKHVNKWQETETEIICDCGVSVANLSRKMVEKGVKGFEGLTDLPGTIAAAVYGNCGCRGCSVNEMLKSYTLLLPDGNIATCAPAELNLSYRSTSLKRGEKTGTILQVILHKTQGSPDEIQKLAVYHHNIRKQEQPSGVNNLGTTINGGAKPTVKGRVLRRIIWLIGLITSNKDIRTTYPIALKLIGKAKFVPYVYYWNRYMFLDKKAHDLFEEYYEFVKTLYRDARLEIEIKK